MRVREKRAAPAVGVGTPSLFEPAQGPEASASEPGGEKAKPETHDSRPAAPPPEKPSAAVRRTAETPASDTDQEIGTESSLGAAPYDLRPLDLAHAMLAQRKFAEHTFRTNGQGRPACPSCGAGMLRAEKRKGFAQHFVCPRSGVAFYGDSEGLRICLHPAQDVAGRLQSAAIWGA